MSVCYFPRRNEGLSKTVLFSIYHTYTLYFFLCTSEIFSYINFSSFSWCLNLHNNRMYHHMFSFHFSHFLPFCEGGLRERTRVWRDFPPTKPQIRRSTIAHFLIASSSSACFHLSLQYTFNCLRFWRKALKHIYFNTVMFLKGEFIH